MKAKYLNQFNYDIVVFLKCYKSDNLSVTYEKAFESVWMYVEFLNKFQLIIHLFH